MGEIYINPLSNKSADQVILLKQNYKVLDHKIVMIGRIHILKLRLLEKSITLINVYGPNKELDRESFLNKLQEILSTYQYEDYLIIGGDFNFVPNFKLDKYSKGKNMNECEKTKSQKYLNFLQQHFDLIDVWRGKNKTKRNYTWSQPSPLVRCRLDYFLINKIMINLVISTSFLPWSKLNI